METEHVLAKISQVGLLVRNNFCLIVQYNQSHKKWGFPGGRINVGEDPQEAFLRELKEEVGLENVTIMDVLDADVYVFDRGGIKNTLAIIAYKIETTEDPKINTDELSGLRWITEPEIDSIDFFWPCAKRFVTKALQK